MLMLYIYLALIGLCFGSFVNATTWRLRQQFLLQKKGKNDPMLSILTGRSMCVHCKHELGPLDLLPFFSWLFLSGKCRYCKKNIDDNPFIELVMGIIFPLTYFYWPGDLSGLGVGLFVTWLLAIVLLAVLFVYDLRWMILPNRVVFPLVGLSVVWMLIRASMNGSYLDALIGAGFGILVCSGLFWVLFQLSSGKWIGGGDVKLGIALGIFAGGLSEALLLLFVASLTGSIVSLPLAMKSKQASKYKVPFGPFLILGLFVVVMFGSSIIHWYKKHILYSVY